MLHLSHSPRRHLLPLVIGLGLLLGALVPPAQAAERTRIQAFLSVTGFDVALDSITLSASDAPAMLGLDAGRFGADWTRLTKEVFDTEVMREMALDILENTLSSEALGHAAEFYASDLGQRRVDVENAAHMEEDGSIKQTEGGALIAQMLREGSPRLEYYCSFLNLFLQIQTL